jgi:MFS family permease
MRAAHGDAGVETASRAELRARLLVTLAYCLQFVGLGLMPGVVGPTLPALATKTGVGSASALAPTYIARGVFYGGGTIIMGAVMDRCISRAHRLLVLWQLVMAACGLLYPLAGSLPLLVLAVAGMNFAGGCVDVLGNVLLVKVWHDDDVRGAPAMNLLHAAWSCGSTLAPMIAKAIGLDAAQLTTVYTTVAALTAISAVPLLHVPLPRGALAPASLASADSAAAGDELADSARADSAVSDTASAEQTRQHSGGAMKVPATRFYVCMASMFIFYCCLGAAERMPGDWLTTVTARSPALHATEQDGAAATSAFFGARIHAAARNQWTRESRR